MESIKRGRKPIVDKKKEISLFIEQSTIEKLGKEKIKQISYNAIQESLLRNEKT